MDSYTRWWVTTEARHNYYYWFASALLQNFRRSGDVALLNRLSPIFDLGLFARQEGTLAELLRESTVVRLGQLPNDRVKKAAAEFLLFDIYSHLLASGHTQQTRFVLLIDEAHRIANLEAMKLLLREARAFGCAVLLSSQTAVDFDDLIYANAGTVLSMRLSDAQSAKAAAKHVCDAEGDQKGVAEQLRSLETFHGALRNSHYPGPTWLRLTPFFERIAAHES